MHMKYILTGALLTTSCSHDLVEKYTNQLQSTIPSKKSVKKADLSIDYIDKNRFRIHQSYSRVWDNMLDLVLKTII